MKTHKQKPSKMQFQAIMHGEGPARVLAAPGSGKTFVIIQRIYYLIKHHHVIPEHILCVTFTKAAALSMEQRFYHEFPDISDETDKKVHFSTIHSLCYQILKQSGQFLNYALISERTKGEMIKQLLATVAAIQEADSEMAQEVLSEIGRKKNTSSCQIPHFLEEEQFLQLYKAYASMLEERKLFDFDDMTEKCCRLLSENQRERKKWQLQYRYILVDEFQDVNQKQYELLKILASPEDNFFIVGDDDQAIYGFRGAMPGIMQLFEEDFPSRASLFLTENYRSGSKIVALASAMITENKNRFPKEPVSVRGGGKVEILFAKNRAEEEAKLLLLLKEKTKEELINTAIILRTNREVFFYQMLLKKHGILLKEKEKEKNDLFHHFIMDDICAFLRFIYEGNKRVDFLRFMNKPERYIARQAVINEVVTEAELQKYYCKNAHMRSVLSILFEQMKRAATMTPALAIRYFKQVLGYDSYLMAKEGANGEKEKWKEDIAKIQKLFTQMHEGEKVDLFLRKAEGAESYAEKEQKYREGVSVITMHAAKGLEFSSVILPDLNEGVIPDRSSLTQDSLEEERRLLYVAITRAKDNLYLLYTKERNRKPTRFLKKILTK